MDKELKPVAWFKTTYATTKNTIRYLEDLTWNLSHLDVARVSLPFGLIVPKEGHMGVGYIHLPQIKYYYELISFGIDLKFEQRQYYLKAKFKGNNLCEDVEKTPGFSYRKIGSFLHIRMDIAEISQLDLLIEIFCKELLRCYYLYGEILDIK